jgi:hypothetical protein
MAREIPNTLLPATWRTVEDGLTKCIGEKCVLVTWFWLHVWMAIALRSVEGFDCGRSWRERAVAVCNCVDGYVTVQHFPVLC